MQHCVPSCSWMRGWLNDSTNLHKFVHPLIGKPQAHTSNKHSVTFIYISISIFTNLYLYISIYIYLYIYIYIFINAHIYWQIHRHNSIVIYAETKKHTCIHINLYIKAWIQLSLSCWKGVSSYNSGWSWSSWVSMLRLSPNSFLSLGDISCRKE